jgi:uncharacterized protein YutE (UPF0331/DUF86 family)
VVDRDLVMAKAAVIDRCLRRIADVRGPRRSSLEPVDVDEIVAFNLQRAVQASMDMAVHVVDAEGYGLPESAVAALATLVRERLIDEALAERLGRMIGFRNVAVHGYRDLDRGIVESIASGHLNDLRAFARLVMTRFGFVPG